MPNEENIPTTEKENLSNVVKNLSVQIARGNASSLKKQEESGFILKDGSLFFDKTNSLLVIGDGENSYDNLPKIGLSVDITNGIVGRALEGKIITINQQEYLAAPGSEIFSNYSSGDFKEGTKSDTYKNVAIGKNSASFGENSIFTNYSYAFGEGLKTNAYLKYINSGAYEEAFTSSNTPRYDEIITVVDEEGTSGLLKIPSDLSRNSQYRNSNYDNFYMSAKEVDFALPDESGDAIKCQILANNSSYFYKEKTNNILYNVFKIQIIPQGVEELDKIPTLGEGSSLIDYEIYFMNVFYLDGGPGVYIGKYNDYDSKDYFEIGCGINDVERKNLFSVSKDSDTDCTVKFMKQMGIKYNHSKGALEFIVLQVIINGRNTFKSYTYYSFWNFTRIFWKKYF